MPKLCVFSPFSCTFPFQTKSILHIHFKIISNSSYIIKYTQSSFNTYLSSRSFMIFSQNNSNMGLNPYTYQIHNFIRVCSNPTPFTLQLNRKSNLKGRTPCFFLVHLGFYPQHLNKSKVWVIFPQNPRQRRRIL